MISAIRQRLRRILSKPLATHRLQPRNPMAKAGAMSLAGTAATAVTAAAVIPPADELKARRSQTKDGQAEIARQNPIYKRCQCQIWNAMVQETASKTEFKVGCKMTEDEDDDTLDIHKEAGANTKAIRTLEEDLTQHGYQVGLRWEQRYDDEQLARRLGIMPWTGGGTWHFTIAPRSHPPLSPP